MPKERRERDRYVLEIGADVFDLRVPTVLLM